VIAVLDYGIGNLRSAEKALVHLGADACLVTDPEVVAGAQGVVVPGVGAFGPCADALHRSGMREAALDAVDRGVPFLGICIGFQLLYEGSEEAPGVKGLGILDGTVRALPPGVKSPQMQWNQLSRVGSSESVLLAGLGEQPWVYFVHSYAPEMTDAVVATCDYGGRSSLPQSEAGSAELNSTRRSRVLQGSPRSRTSSPSSTRARTVRLHVPRLVTRTGPRTPELV